MPTADKAYADLIAGLDPNLPMHGLTDADVKLTGPELAVVMEHHGGHLVFITDALDSTNSYEHIAIRATTPDIAQATMACGLRVMAALLDYAASLVIRDVLALRDRQAPEYTFIDECRDYGVPVQGAP